MKNRRHFLKSTASWGLFGGCFLNMFGRQQAMAFNDPNPNAKLIFIFQRGGNDGINTLIPHGATQDYNTTTRPNLYIPPVDALDLGNGFASLHPNMSALMEVYNSTALNGVAGMGNLAAIHRVAYEQQSRSHFDSQDYMEKGVPRNPAVKDGMFYRQLREMLDLEDASNGFAAVSVDDAAMIGLKGDTPFPNFTDPSQFAFRGSANERATFLGVLPTSESSGDGTGVLGMYGALPLKSANHGPLTHGTGVALGGSLQMLAAASGSYTPANGAVYPDNSFGREAENAAMLLKRTPVRIIGLDIGGWDTHVNQGKLNGSQGNQLKAVAESIRALSLDLQDQWQDIIIVSMTEFGRTSAENGSRGTDHAEASVMFVAGGSVKGGVYNCDSASWQQGAAFEVGGRYLSRKTDFRTVFGEIFMRHFGDTRAQLDAVIPGYSEAETSATLAGNGSFNFLNFL